MNLIFFLKKNRRLLLSLSAIAIFIFSLPAILGFTLIVSVSYPLPKIRDSLFHEGSVAYKLISIRNRREALAIAILRHQNQFADQLLKDHQLIGKTKPGDLSLFWYAITTNNFYMVKKLIKLGVDINDTENKVTRYPLASAVIEENLEMTKFLIENGADVNRSTEFWETPIELAKKTKNQELILLIEHAMKIKSQKEGKSPAKKREKEARTRY